jgi:hypothetical protein
MDKFQKDCTALYTGSGYHTQLENEQPSEVNTNINIYASPDFANKWPRFLHISFMIFPSVVKNNSQALVPCQLESREQPKQIERPVPVAKTLPLQISTQKEISIAPTSVKIFSQRINLTPQSEVDLQAYKHELDQFLPTTTF